MNKRIFSLFLLAGLITSHTYAADARRLEDGTATAGTAKVNSLNEGETAPLLAPTPNKRLDCAFLATAAFGGAAFVTGFGLFIKGASDGSKCYDWTDDVNPETGQPVCLDGSFVVTPKFIAGLAIGIGGPVLSCLGCYLARCSIGKNMSDEQLRDI